jgi:hypothetical protein
LHLNGTRDLLARITRDQAAIQAPKTSQLGPNTATAASKKKDQPVNATSKEKKEPNTTTIHNSDGTKSYRVQIRGRVNGKQHSLCKTFSSLTIARAWRKRTITEVELHGFPVPEADVRTVADVLKALLHKSGDWRTSP